MTSIYRQCNNATRTEIALGRTYKGDCQAVNVINSSKDYAQFATESTM